MYDKDVVMRFLDKKTGKLIKYPTKEISKFRFYVI